MERIGSEVCASQSRIPHSMKGYIGYNQQPEQIWALESKQCMHSYVDKINNFMYFPFENFNS